MNFCTFDFEEKTFKLRIRTIDHAELDKMLGGSFLSAFSSEEKMYNIMSTLPPVLYIALKPFAKEQGNYNYADTCALIDRMIDNGWTITEFTGLISKIGEVSGFFPKETAEEIQAALESKDAVDSMENTTGESGMDNLNTTEKA